MTKTEKVELVHTLKEKFDYQIHSSMSWIPVG